MANEDKCYAGNFTAVLNHPTLGNLNLHDNVKNEGVTVRIVRVFARKRLHKTGNAAMRVHTKGTPVVQVALNTAEMSNDVLALLFSEKAPVTAGVDYAETDGNALLPNLGDLKLHPIDAGAATTGDVTINNVRCVSDTVEWVFQNEDDVWFYDSALVFEGIWTASESVFEVATTTDTTPPTVQTTSPADNETGVAIDATVTITFSEDMNENDVTDLRNITIVSALDGVAVGSQTLSYQAATKTVTVGHVNFAAGTTDYLIMISNRCRDLAGNPLAAINWIDFTTVA